LLRWCDNLEWYCNLVYKKFKKIMIVLCSTLTFKDSKYLVENLFLWLIIIIFWDYNTNLGSFKNWLVFLANITYFKHPNLLSEVLKLTKTRERERENKFKRLFFKPSWGTFYLHVFTTDFEMKIRIWKIVIFIVIFEFFKRQNSQLEMDCSLEIFQLKQFYHHTHACHKIWLGLLRYIQ